ncbi:hypothetical protein TNCV_630071 [Trichonephila clavipes]|nr:hypothetical protein TNCV_630071 [Trichonephila clavipes]
MGSLAQPSVLKFGIVCVVCLASWVWLLEEETNGWRGLIREDILASDSTIDDEAHFWLNGYVNKQNCRIWSEANPQVYVETPLHPEKLTVWCALWAGGILLQKR